MVRAAAQRGSLEIAHPEKLSGLRPVKFEQLEARVHLNTVTWTYSRHTGLVIFAQRQEDEMGVIRPSGRKVVESRFNMFARMDPSIFPISI